MTEIINVALAYYPLRTALTSTRCATCTSLHLAKWFSREI